MSNVPRFAYPRPSVRYQMFFSAMRFDGIWPIVTEISSVVVHIRAASANRFASKLTVIVKEFDQI